MKKTNDHKFCFIIATNQECYLKECLLYIQHLAIPAGYTVDILTITEATSIMQAYNEGMNASDAKYKIYVHQDVLITERHFLQKLLDIFLSDSAIGMIGMIGAPQIAKTGCMWHELRYGDIYQLDELIKSGYKSILRPENTICEVEVIDGLLMATCVDLPWREDIFSGWDFYDVSQSLEFRRAGYKIVVPRQAPSWTIHVDGFISLYHYRENQLIALKNYPEITKNKDRLRILFVNSNIINLIGLPSALIRMGHNVSICPVVVTMEIFRADEAEAIAEKLELDTYDLVASYDFSPTVAFACKEVSTPYFSWVYDAPQLDLYTEWAQYECNYICTFDKQQIKRLTSKNLKHLIYQPLATEVDNFGSIVITSDDEIKYRSDISFVGRLYDKRGFEQLFPDNDIFSKEAMQIINEIQGKWQPGVTLFGKTSDALIEHCASKVDSSFWDIYNFDKRYYFESMKLTRKANELERIQILNYLSEKYEVTLYTEKRKYSALSKKIHLRPWISYLTEMPKVFYLSKINLNITSRSIESGIPQRVFDVLAVGGFLLTNYQPELEDYFVIGEDLEVFHDLKELDEKVAYYMAHEEERVRIGINGYKKVRELHTYEKRMEKILNIIFD